MSFEIVITHTQKGIQHLRQLHVKLYFDGRDIDADDIKEDRADPILVECVKSIMKEKSNYKKVFTIYQLPLEYCEIFSIGNSGCDEHLIIGGSRYNNTNKKIKKIIPSAHSDPAFASPPNYRTQYSLTQNYRTQNYRTPTYVEPRPNFSYLSSQSDVSFLEHWGKTLGVSRFRNMPSSPYKNIPGPLYEPDEA